jgi:hypothetical protein
VDFGNINYLKNGTIRQQAAFDCLNSLNLFNILENYEPLLTGTIPIDIDLPESDLDVICSAQDLNEFHSLVKQHFGSLKAFKIRSGYFADTPNVVANFYYKDFEIEIFCQPISSKKQNAYVHMIVEHRLISSAHSSVKQELRRLKALGWKTEPAFAHLFELKGDPYQALLNLSSLNDSELHEIASKWRAK